MVAGVIFSEDETRALVSWCIEKEMHLIADEIYAMSVFSDPATRFSSVWDLAHGQKKQGTCVRASIHFLRHFLCIAGLVERVSRFPPAAAGAAAAPPLLLS